jgi:hypothetical protein
VANSEAQSKHSRRSRKSEARVETEVGVGVEGRVGAKLAPIRVPAKGKPPKGSNKNVGKDKKPGDVGVRLNDGSFNEKHLSDDQGSKRSAFSQHLSDDQGSKRSAVSQRLSDDQGSKRSAVSQRLSDDQGSKRSAVSQRLSDDQGSKRSVGTEDAPEANALWFDKNLTYTETPKNGNSKPGSVKFEDTDTIAERINEKLSEKIITNVDIEITPSVDLYNNDS